MDASRHAFPMLQRQPGKPFEPVDLKFAPVLTHPPSGGEIDYRSFGGGVRRKVEIHHLSRRALLDHFSAIEPNCTPAKGGYRSRVMAYKKHRAALRRNLAHPSE